MNHNKLRNFLSTWAVSFCTLFIAGLLFRGCAPKPAEPETVAGYRTLEDLDGHSVSVISSSTSDVLLSDTNNFPNIEIVRYKTPTELIEAVRQGVTDCGVTDTVVLMTLDMTANGLAVDFNLPGGFDVAAAFNKKDEKLCKQFDEFLMQMKSSGLLDSMFARWCSPRVDTVAMPQIAGLEHLKGHPVEVATLTDNAPFSFFRNGVWTGLEVELALRFSLYIGRPVHFSGYYFDDIIGVLKNKQADMACANLFVTPDRTDEVLFSFPYYLCKTCCFSKAK